MFGYAISSTAARPSSRSFILEKKEKEEIREVSELCTRHGQDNGTRECTALNIPLSEYGDGRDTDDFVGKKDNST